MAGNSKEGAGGSTSTGHKKTKPGRHVRINSESDFSAPWLCLGCEDAIDTEDFDSIECSKCSEWCHRRCSDLDRDEFRVAQKGNSLLSYTCQKCNSKSKDKSLSQKDASRIENKVDKMLDMFHAFTKKMVSTLDDHKTELHRRVDKVESNMEKQVEIKVKEAMLEEKEREMRKNNAILVNLPESGDSNPEQRQKDDVEETLKILEKVLGEKVASSEIDNPVRIGTRQVGKDSKPRLLKIQIANEAFRRKLFSKTKKFNEREGDPKKKVYVNPDRTPKEREDYKKLRAELKERQKTNPNLIISRGKIVTKREHISDRNEDSQNQERKRKSSEEGARTTPKRQRGRPPSPKNGEHTEEPMEEAQNVSGDENDSDEDV